jgi:NitT/TauT family transport system substrate-binding protein
VVYLYNGRNGVSSFDPTLKPEEIAALEHDVPFLESIGVIEDPLDLDAFVDDSVVQKAYGDGYDQAAASETNPAAITGTDEVCDTKVKDPELAGEVWVDGEAEPRPVADPTCLLRNVAQVEDDGGTVRASYVPDALTHTRWFADRMLWVRDGEQLLPFATAESAGDYLADHHGAEQLSYADALDSVR